MRQRLIAVGVASAVLIVLPFVVSEFRTAQLATVGASFVAILGLDILAHSNGQISLGHGAFMAVGAYTTGVLVSNHGVRDVWTIAAAAGVAGGFGLLAGIPALRLPGLYLAVVTFGIAVALPTIIDKFDHFTGGPTGISFFGTAHQTGQGAGVRVLGVHLSNNQWLYALTWVIGVALFGVAWWLLTSRFGRSLRAVHDSELSATAVGVNKSAYTVAAFGLSAAYAGVAGALLAINVAYVSPSLFPIQLSLYLVVGLVVGLGSIWGAVFGALLIQFLPDIVGAIPNVDTTQGGPITFAFGAVLVALMLVSPLVVKLRTRLPPRKELQTRG
jgi:branched-chain amino acid transport system permease protein